MITGQNYKQYISQQGQLQRNIAQGWGYKLNSQQYLPIKQKINAKLKVAPIEPLRQKYNIPPSKALIRVEQELLMLQNQRKLNELTQKAFQKKDQLPNEQLNQSAAIKMMHQCVQQYNFIVDHRHILENNSEKTRKIFGIKKSQSKVIFDEIKMLKDQLGHCRLTQTIKINQQIAKLYKKYSNIIPKSIHTTQRATQNHSKSQINRAFTSGANSQSYLDTNRLSPNKKTDHNNSSIKTNEPSPTKKEANIELKDLMIMQELNQSQQGSQINDSRVISPEMFQGPQSLLLQNVMIKMKRRVSQYAPPRRRLITVVNIQQQEKQEKRQRMNTTIQQAYTQKDVIQKGKKLDKTLQDHQDALEIWRQKITDTQQKNQALKVRLQPKPRIKKFKKLLQSAKPMQTDKKPQQSNAKIDSAKGVYRVYRIEQIKRDMAQKQKILSTILKKKESKFKRIPGTQILHKNDVNSLAKQFLGVTKHDNFSQHAKREQSDRKVIKHNTSDEGHQWQKLQVDNEDLYWSMCRNQKINLLLKSKKEF